MCACVRGKARRQARIIFLCLFGVGEEVELGQMVFLSDLVSPSGVLPSSGWSYRKLAGVASRRHQWGFIRMSALWKDQEAIRR